MAPRKKRITKDPRPSTPSPRTLADLVQSLPAELYNNVLELTLTFDDDIVYLDDYRPPVQLQISRGIRNDLLPRFYGTTLFVSIDPGYDEVLKWLLSLPKETVDMVRGVSYEADVHMGDGRTDAARLAWRYLLRVPTIPCLRMWTSSNNGGLFDSVILGLSQVWTVVSWKEDDGVKKERMSLLKAHRALSGR